MKTTKRKWLSVLLIAALALVVLAGCGGGGDSTGSGEDTSASSTETESADTTDSTAADDTAADTSAEEEGALSANLANLTIVLEGDTVDMFITLEDFLALGWELDEYDADEKLEKNLEPETEASLVVKKDDLRIGLYVGNLLKDQPAAVPQSSFAGISMKYYLSDAVFELPEGIKRGISTKDDVIAAYGEPSDSREVYGILDKEDEGFSVLEYSKEDYTITIWCDLNSGVVEYCDINSTGIFAQITFL